VACEYSKPFSARRSITEDLDKWQRTPYATQCFVFISYSTSYKQNLERDIFGGSNSELSSDEEEGMSNLPPSTVLHQLTIPP